MKSELLSEAREAAARGLPSRPFRARRSRCGREEGGGGAEWEAGGCVCVVCVCECVCV